MHGNKRLILVAPHPSRGFLADFKRLLRRYLTGLEALYAVIGNDFAFHAETPLNGDHLGIGVLLGTVDTADKHLFVGFVIILGIAECGIQVFVKVLFRGSLVGVVGVFKCCFQISVNGPESCNCDSDPSFPGISKVFVISFSRSSISALSFLEDDLSSKLPSFSIKRKRVSGTTSFGS